MKSFWKKRQGEVITILLWTMAAVAIILHDKSREEIKGEAYPISVKSFEPSAALERFRMRLGW